MSFNKILAYVAAGLVLLVILISAVAFVRPQYRVYAQRLEGQAILAKAESEKMAMVEQAKAELESAKLRAEAIEVIGAKAQQYPEYRQQEFIGAFADAVKSDAIHQIIYVPTEGNVPIVEARHR